NFPGSGGLVGLNPPGSSTLTVSKPAISLLKTASTDTYSAAGTAITYSYLVTNTGDEALDGVAVTDPMPGLWTVSCPIATLAPGASETCTATYATTQADVDAGSLSNTGTVTGTSPNGTTVNAQSSVTIPAIASPGLSIVKSLTSGGG